MTSNKEAIMTRQKCISSRASMAAREFLVDICEHTGENSSAITSIALEYAATHKEEFIEYIDSNIIFKRLHTGYVNTAFEKETGK